MGYNLWIDGKSVACKEHYDIFNPANNELLGECPIATEAQLNDAVAAAAKAYKTWSQVSDEERKNVCHAMGQVLEDNAEELSKLLTEEQGKPLNFDPKFLPLLEFPKGDQTRLDQIIQWGQQELAKQ